MSNEKECSCEWATYQRLFEADREDNKERFEKLFVEVQKISHCVTEIKTERRVAKLAGSYVIPASMGLVAAYVARKLGLG